MVSRKEDVQRNLKESLQDSSDSIGTCGSFNRAIVRSLPYISSIDIESEDATRKPCKQPKGLTSVGQTLLLCKQSGITVPSAVAYQY